MAFPTNPVNNQTYNDGTYTYRYNSTFRTWTKIAQTTSNVSNVVTQTGNITTGNTSVTPNTVVVGNTTVATNSITVGNTVINNNNVSIGTTKVASGNVTVGNTSITNDAVNLGNTSITGNSITSPTLTGNLVSGTTSITPLPSGNVAITVGGVSNAVVFTNTGANINGNANITGNLSTSGNINFSTSSNVSLGNISNIRISGGSNGYFLQTDGNGNLSWTPGGGGNGSPGGSNTQVQYNKNANFAGSAFFTFNDNTNTLQIAGNLIANSLQMGAGVYKWSTSLVYFATTASTSPGQVLYTIPVANIAGVDFQIIATDPSGPSRQFCRIDSLYYNGNVQYNEYASLFVNGGVGNFEVDYNAGNIISQPSLELKVTPSSPNVTSYKMMITVYND